MKIEQQGYVLKKVDTDEFYVDTIVSNWWTTDLQKARVYGKLSDAMTVQSYLEKLDDCDVIIMGYKIEVEDL